MDMMVIGGTAIVGLIIGILAGFVMKKPKLRILIFAGIGFVIGAGAGYFIAPIVISFM